MKFFDTLFYGIIGSLLFLGLVVEGYGQVLRNTRVVNSCVSEYTLGTATQDEYVIIVFTCSSTWTSTVQIAEFAEALVVAGGGGGGKRNDTGGVRGAGGGGAGGVTYINNSSLLPVNGFATLNVTVGNGGFGSSNPSLRGGTGEDSRVDNTHFPVLISKGGGGGGSADLGTIVGDDQRAGGPGGSGGGGVSKDILGGIALPLGPDNTGIGNRGGNGAGTPTESPTGGGGGGGVAQVGQTPGATQAGRGGNGAVYLGLTQGLLGIVPQGFAGGGGGVGGNSANLFPKADQPNGGVAGGIMIGGSGINNDSGQNGLINTGSGGGAGGSLNPNVFKGGDGGSGIVIFKYLISSILPVEYVYTEARFLRQTRSSIISWATSKEWESSHFEIERTTQGLIFEKIGEVEAAGWSDATVEYEFEDKNLPLTGGNILYRLKQVDFDGTFSYTSVMTVRVPSVEFTSGVWRAFPNPTDGSELRISLLDASQYNQEPLTFRLIHPTAQTRPITVTSESEMNEMLSQMLLKIPKGVFVVEIQWGQKVEHIKVLKK